MPRKERSDKGKSKYTPRQKATRKEKFTKKATEAASKRKGVTRTTKGRYTPQEIEQFKVTPREQLTRYQRKITGLLPHETVKPKEIAGHTGLTEDEIQRAIHRRFRGGIDERSLEYIPSKGFYATTESGETVVLFGVRNLDDPEDYRIAFGTASDLEKVIATRSGCISPPCTADGSEAEVVIYLKGGNERSNIA